MKFLGKTEGEKQGFCHWIGLVAVLVAMTAGCGSDDAVGVDDPFPKSSGVYRQVLESRNMRYAIALPPNYNPAVPAPLILALHYGGEVTPYYGEGFLDILIGPALQDLDAIMVAPDANGSWSNAQSEADLLALLDVINANYNIDPKKTLITGFSMGGAGTWYMASRHQDRFRAAIPISARPIEGAADVAWTIPILAVHSVADEVVPFEPVRTTVVALQEKGVSVSLIVVEGVTHFQTQLFVTPLEAAVPWVQSAWE
ncbi:MAG: prolyl oligopeptidase family serine peptidase [bacterium]|nr:prolyl oligopeptidase family serine peptidase [bacterium]